MIYSAKNDVAENKIITCFPVLVIKFDNHKRVYFIKHDYLYCVDNYFFSQICEEDNILCANSEGEALALIGEIKSHPNSEQLILLKQLNLTTILLMSLNILNIIFLLFEKNMLLPLL